jgi:hypothetical protein
MSAELPPIAYGTFYHIYNRGNNRENIFPQERNYAYFMDLWWKHISPIAETWAYGLLRNHFHAAVFIKRREDLSGLKSGNVRRETGAGQNAIPADSREDLTGLKEPKDLTGFGNLSGLFSYLPNTHYTHKHSTCGNLLH